MSSIGNAIALSIAITCTGGICYVATFSHAGTDLANPVVVATMVTLVGSLPPLWLGRLISNGPASQLAVIGWRLAVMLPSLAMLGFWEGGERNCFLITLLACYFVALPLESWLLIQDVKRNQDS